MKSFRKVVVALFGFNRRERRGTYILAVLLVVFTAVRFIAFRPGEADDGSWLPGDTADGQQVTAGAVAQTKKLFTFDPNTVPYDDLLSLGLTERQATTLINYRLAGARFRRPGDLVRVYGIDSATAASLLPYVSIDSEGEREGPARRTYQADSAVQQSGHSGARLSASSSGDAPHAVLIDLNRCSEAALESLPGIGPVLAARIIRYRTLLGGFVDSRQLTEVYGLDSSVAILVGPMVTVTFDSVTPLLLDSASFGDLARHPYVGYDAARLITRYRSLTDTPLTLGQMVRGDVITARQAEQMAPYVRPSPGVTGTDYEFISSKVLK